MVKHKLFKVHELSTFVQLFSLRFAIHVSFFLIQCQDDQLLNFLGTKKLKKFGLELKAWFLENYD